LDIAYSTDKALVKINGRVYYRLMGSEGDYHYHLIDGCEFNYLNIEENASSRFAVYPNPSENIFYVQNPKSELLQIRALNIYGSEVFNANSSNTLIPLDLSRFSSGAYILEITSDPGRAMKKIIKQ